MLKRPRPWFVLAALLLVAMLFVGGPIGGLLAALAFASFIVAVFVKVHDQHPEDRPIGTGMFGGGGF
jgi:Na+/H+ antiporter NhaC